MDHGVQPNRPMGFASLGSIPRSLNRLEMQNSQLREWNPHHGQDIF